MHLRNVSNDKINSYITIFNKIILIKEDLFILYIFFFIYFINSNRSFFNIIYLAYLKYLFWRNALCGRPKAYLRHMFIIKEKENRRNIPVFFKNLQNPLKVIVTE